MLILVSPLSKPLYLTVGGAYPTCQVCSFLTLFICL